jgi:hypothetical protein
LKAKYKDGQKVRIISLSDPQTLMKYPDLEPYDSESGVIASSNWVGLSSLDNKDLYIYTVKMDKDSRTIPVVEDALILE